MKRREGQERTQRMPYKAEITFVAARPFTYFDGKQLQRGDEVELMGAPNDERLLQSSLVRQEVTFVCRKARCGKRFPNIAKLLEHEARHKAQAKPAPKRNGATEE